MEIPDFLLEMSRQMNQQDCRMTADPIWQVRCKRYLVTEQGYNDHHFVLCDDEGEFFRSDTDDKYIAASYLWERHEDWCIDIALEHGDDESELSGFEYFLYTFDLGDLDSYELPGEVRKVFMQEVEDIVSTHLTEADANWFINRKQHDYPKLYTYVESAYFAPQIKELRAWIMGLTAGEQEKKQ